MDFVAIHEVDNKERPFLGWSDDAAPKFNDETFPYGVTLMSDDNANNAVIQHKQELAESSEPPKVSPNEQGRLNAMKRYSRGTGFLGGNPAKTLEEDLAWLAKNTHAGEMIAGLSDVQKQNYEFLKSASSYLAYAREQVGPGQGRENFRARMAEFGMEYAGGKFDMID